MAIQWFLRSGLSYLAENDIDGARKAWKSIIELDAEDSSGVVLLKKIQARQDQSGAAFSPSVSEGASIGFPRIDVLGSTPKRTQGMISQLQGLDDDPNIYQTTVPIQPGNSGGPLLNMQGEVVGVVRSIIGYRTASGGPTYLLQDASCALKVDRVKEIFYHLPQNSYVLSALPRGLDDVEALSQRVQKSMLIVIARYLTGSTCRRFTIRLQSNHLGVLNAPLFIAAVSP